MMKYQLPTIFIKPACYFECILCCSKMKERNVLPDGYMMCDLIEVHVKREDLTSKFT